MTSNAAPFHAGLFLPSLGHALEALASDRPDRLACADDTGRLTFRAARRTVARPRRRAGSLRRGPTEQLVVVVEPLKASDDAVALASEVATAVRDEIGSTPERVLVMAPRSIPLTWNGKIRHAELRAELESQALTSKGRVLYDSTASR